MSTGWESLFAPSIEESDPEIAGLLRRQEEQNRNTINLIASESYCPRATLEAEASILVNKNISGYPPRRDIGGSEIVNRIEGLAIERAKRLFGAEHANVQALSSTIANIAVVRALLRPGGRILSFDMAAGGHMSHGGANHISGRDYDVQTFGVDEDSGKIDLATARKLAEAFEPHIIIAGSSNYPYRIDFEALHGIGRDVGALLFADIAHVAGLIIAGLHWNPTPSYDVVTTSTHKTFCGPRTGGLVLCKARHAKAIDSALAPGLQAAGGGHIVAARAVLFDIVQRPEFRDLMEAVVVNAKVLAEALVECGVILYAGGTDTHMVVVDLRRTAWTSAGLNPCLLCHGIVASTTTLPALAGADNRLGLRLGSVPMTIRGTDDSGFRTIAENLARVLNTGPDGAVEADVRKTLTGIAEGHPAPLV